jgi:50S ribosomal protein L16 3-hydroxylase
MRANHGDPLLGGLTPARFLARHWQRQPLLARAALPAFRGLLSPRELMRIAQRDDARSRVVMRDGRSWQVHDGPFSPGFFRRLSGSRWTLLVQDVEHFVPQARALLQRFRFVSDARLDDVMVSYAPPGGGVGPHYDSYDVFLLQGLGRRRWRIGRQRDLALVGGAPLKLLARFRPQRECVLEPGDMLYLPPRWAHDGVALDECMTYSIGFRAPAWRELACEFLGWLSDHLRLEGIYADPGLAPTRQPARLDPRMARAAQARLARIRWSGDDVTRFLGCHLTEPKPQVVFDAPQAATRRAVFLQRARRTGLAPASGTRILYTHGLVFINGECEAVRPGVLRRVQALADAGHIRLRASEPAALIDLLLAWQRAGWLRYAQRDAATAHSPT